ncbi:MAG: hypothetical protein ACI9HK_005910 [Pirellulaceae bacterium]|jgi:hypothetical protein
MKERVVTIRKTTVDEATDHGFFPGSMDERMDFAWKLSKEVWSLVPNQNVERRLQRHVAVLVRRKG